MQSYLLCSFIMLRLHQHIDFPGLEKKFLQLQVNDDKKGKLKEGKGGRK